MSHDPHLPTFPWGGVEQHLILDVFKSCQIYGYIIYSRMIAYPHNAASDLLLLGTTDAAINFYQV